MFRTAPETLAYGTLAEALRYGVIVVTEVNAGGSIPDLKVINNADSSVLLLDGEELKGAKQNRVLNASGPPGCSLRNHNTGQLHGGGTLGLHVRDF